MNVQLLKQPHQIWIGAMVKHQEAGIHTKLLTINIDIYGVGVPTKVVAGFVQRDIMAIAR